MIHFTLGPVEMYERTKMIGALQNKYFRTSEFSEFIRETDLMLKRFLNAPASYQTVFLSGSGTAAMDATLLNCLTPDDKVLIINGGKFAGYFVDMCAYQKIQFDTLDVPFGQPLLAEMLLPHESKGYSALLVNIHETSTGQLYDKALLEDFCKRNGMYYIVDAISSVCADELDLSKIDMDAVILSSQKGFACSPGLSIVLMSNKLYDERVRNNSVTSMYFDFKSYVSNMERFQTPFTPPIGILYQINDMLKYLLDMGPERTVSNTHRLAKYYREQLKTLSLKPLDYPLSNAMTPVYLRDISAYDVHMCLKEKHDILINPSGLLRDNLLIVGHLGNLCEENYDMLISVMQTVIKELQNGKR